MFTDGAKLCFMLIAFVDFYLPTNGHRGGFIHRQEPLLKGRHHHFPLEMKFRCLPLMLTVKTLKRFSVYFPHLMGKPLE